MSHGSRRIDRPVLIVSTPRSGSTLLFETLAKAPGLFTTGSESHRRIEQIADFAPPRRGWESNRLLAHDASEANVAALTDSFLEGARDRDGRSPEGATRILEKTPKNALRTPFFATAWPDSVFVYLRRPARPTIASMIEAWVSGRFRTYPMLPGWSGYPWSLILTPGWRELIGKPLPQIVASQWATTTDILLDDLEVLPPERLRIVDYDAFIADPQACLADLCRSLDLEWDQQLDRELDLSRFTVTRPEPDKWRRIAHLIEPVASIFEAADRRARDFAALRA